eukprot:5762543-Amphidinium_carterae.1
MGSYSLGREPQNGYEANTEQWNTKTHNWHSKTCQRNSVTKIQDLRSSQGIPGFCPKLCVVV